MKRMLLTNWTPFNNILYIGDEAKACIAVIEKFNISLSEIEKNYAAWFNRLGGVNRSKQHDKLQHHIQYHFEGGIAVFKFKNQDGLPENIRRECLNACQNLMTVQY